MRERGEIVRYERGRGRDEERRREGMMRGVRNRGDEGIEKKRTSNMFEC